MKVLIVEDEDVLAKVLREKFEKEKFEVEIASDGEAALDKAVKFNPDIIILDLLLPKKDGFEVLEELKKIPEIKKIPVIILSNLDKDENISRAMKLGATNYIAKTQHPMAEIVDMVKNLLVLHK